MRHPKGFPSRLVRLRADAGMTQKDLAKASGISVPQIGRYETGTSSPRLSALVKLSEALGVTIDDLQDVDQESKTVTLILEEVGGEDLPLTIDRSAFELLQKAAEETGKPLGDIVSDTLLWGLRMIKESPEFAASLRRQIKESREPDDGE
ncbi:MULTISPECIES: helix-turn-helix domain-containing protein [unclassified Pseudomonas]|uniref:helix-turn-helix domain-containing protein n=1 Tax=unclassified Pseudomonas TaxID=196821 RepID=UPI0021BACCD2|nr:MULTISPECIES: helix-turn-helix transcriptional regulator [unclassified Pseudomonas]MCT8165626.1 helix-turn-helix domain-containing protein [Pseudomonas sp. HD6422]MCT8183624.1 helix-turn-helix domain-containing protein [Pseudomonas sp. HD6421]